MKGRAAHAGIAPQDGRNAAVELIHQIQADDVFPKTGDGLTANLTVMSAGTRDNIIPEDASAPDQRPGPREGRRRKVQAVLEKNAADDGRPRHQGHASASEPLFPPLPINPAPTRWPTGPQAIYAGLGLTISRGGNGGARNRRWPSRPACRRWTAWARRPAASIPTREYLVLGTVTPRLYLLTKLIQELGHAPPPRLK